jgi:predicted transcriptional regulator/DNA-binding CsgD family transcriptional regulator
MGWNNTYEGRICRYVVNTPGGDVLQPLGLGPTEERVYDAMVMGQAATVTELAGQIGVPRASVAQAVQALTAKGLVTRLPGRAARFSPLDPAIAVSTLTEIQEQALHAARDRMRELAGLYQSHHKGTHPAEQVEIIDGADNVWSTHIRVQYAATQQIRFFDTPPYVTAHPEQENSDERVVLSKGVTVRCVYARDGVLVPGRQDHIRAAIRWGEQARTAASLPMKMMICDNHLALIPVMPVAPVRNPAAYLIHPSSLLDALAALFEAYWSRAVPLNLAAVPEAVPEAADQDGITAADHRILALLAAGATDEAIGRATGCSMRTVQRRIRELMQLVGAQTRFQLGMAATARRWV